MVFICVKRHGEGDKKKVQHNDGKKYESEGSLYEVFLVFFELVGQDHPLPATRRPLYMDYARQEPYSFIPFFWRISKLERVHKKGMKIKQ